MQWTTHSSSRASGSRPGFTLVELMVVIAIIGVVATLAASATMQVMTRQRAANTELTIQKVNDALKAHYRAVFDQAKTEPIPDGVLAMASPDPANPDPNSMPRARLIWIKLRLKQQFPMNFMEALNPTPNTIRPSYVLLQPAPVFSQAVPAALAANQPQIYESSVCLLLALSQSRKGVVAFDQDRLSSTELADCGAFNPSAAGLKAIVDGWGKPLVFYRWPIGGEVELTDPNPNTNLKNRPSPPSPPPLTSDPLDPDALLMNQAWNNQQSYGQRKGVWAFEKLFHPVHDVNTSAYTRRSYYTVPVIASAGPVIGSNLTVYSMMGLPMPQEYGPAVPLPAALLHDPMNMAAGTTDSFDNIYSFRMRLGARGD